MAQGYDPVPATEETAGTTSTTASSIGETRHNPEPSEELESDRNDEQHHDSPSDKHTTEKEKDQPQQALPARRPLSISTITQLATDLLLAVPALLFIIYAIIVCRNNGAPYDSETVLKLRAISRFGPTVFPIVYAAAVANLLKSFANWRLERGITILSLHVLQSSRTVFSALATPVKTRALGFVTFPIVLLWLLSPFGGQASLRVISEEPFATYSTWHGRTLDGTGPFRHGGAFSSSGKDIVPAIVGAFTAALSSPASIKEASRDAFGNVKIPMIEPLEDSDHVSRDEVGWFHLKDRTDLMYSSLAGFPIQPSGGFKKRTNYTFTMNTSYITANCKLHDHPKLHYKDWFSYVSSGGNPLAIPASRYFNGESLVLILPSNFMSGWVTYPSTPLNFTLSSYHPDSVTNATCLLLTSYLEAEIACWYKDCDAVRIRRDPKPRNNTYETVIHDEPGKINTYDAFFSTFINSTSITLRSQASKTHIRASPLECYMINPEFPYAFNAECSDNDKRRQMWNTSNTIYSRRLSQLLNTFWISSIAPYINSGGAQFADVNPRAELPVTDAKSRLMRYINGTEAPGKNVTGEMIPDYMVLQVNRAWMALLFIASLTMLLSAATAAFLGVLRQGPEMLDHPASMLKDNVHIQDGSPNSSMEEGDEKTRRLKDTIVCLGDATPNADKGYLAIGTRRNLEPLTGQVRRRLYI
ncbi:hypothetical protein FSARC_5959 [Fusarium sarcochroum]|uniref:Uncharacterized protein n=1 Tax=Fusarium sarcochroum TaxID=1208366 RepID=A0A8H4X9V2_9HYPO|nr:hypothetical protein FSARC_5959 [Fusarium sarcochroum]